MPKNPSAPFTETILIAVSQLVDDAQASARRDPSHFDLESVFKRHGIAGGDPHVQGQRNVGKAKRVRAALSWALEYEPQEGGEAVYSLLNLIRGYGGFRQGSPNHVGVHAYENAAAAFAAEGYELCSDGELRARLLDNLSGFALTAALQAYVRRAKRGASDAALVTGTGKDLLEAVSAHVVQHCYGSYPSTSNFPTLLGQAFIALGFATPHDQVVPGELASRRIERAMYELACGINQLRNKEGTGHGRPWLPTVTDAEARMAIECMGIIAERLLARLDGP